MVKIVKKYYIILVLLGMLTCFVSINIIANFLGEKGIIDLTTEKRYSLSEYSIKEAREISQPLYITIYYSSEVASENPVYNKYAEFVIRFLQQYQRQNPDKILIAIKDPKPYSAVETEARQAGISSFTTDNGETNLYFGAVFKNSDEKTEVIPYFSAERDFWLEKDITTVFAKFNEQKRKVVGFISPIHPLIKKEYGKQLESYLFLKELSQRYDIIQLLPNEKEIPANIDVLIVAVPRKMSVALSYALDQYVLRGGKLILLLDTIVEEPYYKSMAETTDKINKLLKNWGLSITRDLVGSRPYGKKIFLEMGEDGLRQVSYPLWIDLDANAINQDSPITKNLKTLSLRTPVEIKELEHDEEIRVTPLLQVTESFTYPEDTALTDKKNIISSYQPNTETKVLAALSEGKYLSTFTETPEFIENTKYQHLFYSYLPTQILVVGDSDFMRDNVWLNDDELNDNGQFLLKAVEVMSDNEGIARLYKSQSKIHQESLAEHLFNRSAHHYLDKISLLQNEYENLRQEHEYLREAIQNHQQNMDAYTASRINGIRDKANEIKEKLQYYEYSIKRSFNTEMQKIIFINIAVFPFIIVLLWIIGYNRHTRIRRQKIKDKFNDHK